MIFIILKDFRCHKCQKLLGKYLECRQLEIKCPRCGAQNSLRDTAVFTKIIKDSLTAVSSI
ncbi:MAG TPA: Com family DNA-binding transcriptional regulator [Syntrophomonadaceae bacterium]|nr:Com family DNA-binding transcriptional regulator [Syntrophomonadaceae bacterium]